MHSVCDSRDSTKLKHVLKFSPDSKRLKGMLRALLKLGPIFAKSAIK